MIENWLEITVIVFFVAMYARMWFIMRDFHRLTNMVHDLHDHVFMQTGDVQVGDGDNFHVMSLEDFKDRFGFDPRGEEPPNTYDGKASASEIEAWDNS